MSYTKEQFREYKKENSDYFNRKHKEWRKRNKEQFKCNVAFQKYKIYHKIKTGECELCFSDKAEGHHNDYSKPLVIVWLCKECHEWSHKMGFSLDNLETNIKLKSINKRP